MRWDRLTGLEAETQEDRQKLRSNMWGFLTSFGRIAVVTLLLFALLVSLDAEVWEQLARTVEVGPYTIGFTLLDPLAIAAYCWSLAPMFQSVYGLWKLKQEAHHGPPRYEWEVDADE